MRQFLLVSVMFSLLCSCASQKNIKKEELYNYAESNCLYWYFDKMGYETSDIRSISGGIVEMSDEPIEKFQSIALFIKDYSPALSSKGGIDVDLYRCFHLRRSQELKGIIER